MSVERGISPLMNLETTKASNDELDRLTFRITAMAESLSHSFGREIRPTHIVPPDLFLARPMTVDERSSLDKNLALEYAEIVVGLQDKIAQVPIEEGFEKFVFLPDLFSKRGVNADFSQTPFHQACGEWAGKPREFWTRESVANRLSILGAAFNENGLQIRFEDAFRPVGVQEGLFKRRVEWTKNDHPDWDIEKVIIEARSKTAAVPRLASHKAGAAVDMTLKALEGEPLDLGNNYPEGGALVVLDCPYVTVDQWITRQIFSVSAEMAGFTVYPGEDWHISAGDNLAGLSSDKSYKAVYGPVKNFDRITGEVTKIYDPSEIDKFFDIS